MADGEPVIRRFADRERLLECVHCGLCLSACPTYLELGTEMDSPRGRIHLLRGLEEGTLPLTADVVRHLDLCLGCRACETACPSGVRYGELIEGARAYIETQYRRPWWERYWRSTIGALFPYPTRLRLLLRPVEMLQRLRLWPAVRRFVPFAGMLSELRLGIALPQRAEAEGAERGRVGLLAGCVARDLCAETNAAAIRVLQRNGWTVVTPAAQGCCGALHLHGGDPGTARRFAKHNIDSFPAELDAIIVTAAGCGAAMKEYGHLLRDDPLYAGRAQAFAEKVRDVTEFLATVPLQKPGRALRAHVTYHDACHLVHGQRVHDAPRALLRAIPGIELSELPEADLCCGSAGSYNLTEPAMAQRLLARKVSNIAHTGATCVTAANPGCILQIRSGLRARGLDVEVLHPVELLDRAYALEETESGRAKVKSQNAKGKS